MAPKLSKAPITGGMIGLARALELVCERRIADWHEIISQIEACSTELEPRFAAMGLRRKIAEHERRKKRDPDTKLEISDFGQDPYAGASSWDALASLDTATDDDFSPEQKETMRLGAEYDALAMRLHWRKVEADRIMREALASGAIVAKNGSAFFDEADFIEWLGGEDAQAQTFTPYPDGVALTAKCQVALDVMKTIWPGLPDKSAQATADRVNSKYEALGWKKNDGRGRPIKQFTEDDIKRIAGRKI
jgi:hypothetical protein